MENATKPLAGIPISQRSVPFIELSNFFVKIITQISILIIITFANEFVNNSNGIFQRKINVFIKLPNHTPSLNNFRFRYERLTPNPTRPIFVATFRREIKFFSHPHKLSSFCRHFAKKSALWNNHLSLQTPKAKTSSRPYRFDCVQPPFL